MKSNFLRRVTAVLALALATSACTIEFRHGPVDDDREPDTSGVVGTGAEGGASGGISDAGGSGLPGDSGGADGAAGGSTPSQGNAGGSGAGELPGGEQPWEDPYCSEAQGSGSLASRCDQLPQDDACPAIADANRAACKRAFALFNNGQAEDLVDCLSYQPQSELCSTDTVTTCLAEMYDDACTMPYVEQVCDSWQQACSDSGESLDADSCKWDLNPFSDAGLTELTTCMNNHPGDCQSRYDDCLATVVQVQPVTSP